jgi:hypothetical protein
MMIDCPHRYTRVVPKSDGACPACQKDTRDTVGLDLSRTTIRVSQGEVLPPVSCERGQRTFRVVSVYRKSSSGDGPTVLGGAAIFGLLSWPLGLWYMLRGVTNTAVVEAKLPQCEACADLGPPEPRYVDFENARMIFVVHTNLCNAVTD